ncbi:hypothetical protein CAEBREN_15088 [Caenorhabditis brenneri]|uniref:Uncharacterized protein n=1 Tax=Caenorhabditis brenneri TaxID=135651 RepID=G0MJU3_CAEBE|nr:hypothetical protein CAEBREN_15088 [Caenorhabditis brenneri]
MMNDYVKTIPLEQKLQADSLERPRLKIDIRSEKSAASLGLFLQLENSQIREAPFGFKSLGEISLSEVRRLLGIHQQESPSTSSQHEEAAPLPIEPTQEVMKELTSSKTTTMLADENLKAEASYCSPENSSEGGRTDDVDSSRSDASLPVVKQQVKTLSERFDEFYGSKNDLDFCRSKRAHKLKKTLREVTELLKKTIARASRDGKGCSDGPEGSRIEMVNGSRRAGGAVLG